MLFKGEKPRLQAVGTVDGGNVQSIVSLVEAGYFFGFREWMVHFRLREMGTPDTTSESVSDKFTISRRKAEAYFYQLKRLFRMREVPYGPPPALPGEVCGCTHALHTSHYGIDRDMYHGATQIFCEECGKVCDKASASIAIIPGQT